jgi:hypothetical protein
VAIGLCFYADVSVPANDPPLVTMDALAVSAAGTAPT